MLEVGTVRVRRGREPKGGGDDPPPRGAEAKKDFLRGFHPYRPREGLAKLYTVYSQKKGCNNLLKKATQSIDEVLA